MTKLRVHSAVILLSALVLCTAQAGQIAVFPRGASGPIAIYSNDLQNLGYIPGPPDTVDVLSTPSGDKYFVISSADAGNLTVATSPLNGTARTIAIGEPAQAGAITPDGRLLIVLASTVRIYDTDSEELVTPPANAGSTPNAVGVSPDSKYAYILSSSSKTLIQIDLDTYLAKATQAVPANAAGVSVAPNGRVYVGGDSKVSVFDGRTLSPIGTIEVAGRAGALSFSADGRYALCPNLSGAAPSLMELDLNTNATAATLTLRNPDGVSIAILDRIDIVSTNRAIGFNKAAGRLYDISYPVLSGLTLTVPGYGQPTSVSGEATSLEFAASRNMFFVNQSTLTRYDLITNNAPGSATIGYTGAVTRLGETPEGTIARFQLDSDGITVPLGSTFLLVARGLDSFGAPVRGASVNFSSTSSGVSITDTTAQTVGGGFATTLVKAPSTEGAFQIKIASGGVSRTFNLQAGSGGGEPCVDCSDSNLVKVQGDGQLVLAGYPADQDLVVKALDADGKPAAGVEVSWSASANAILGSTSVTVTDEDGLASMPVTVLLPQGETFHNSEVTAATSSAVATFSLVAIPLPIGGNAPSIRLLTPDVGGLITVKAGSKLEDAVRVAVGANFGGPIPGVGLSISTGLDPKLGPVATCEGGTVLTDSAGIASCNLIASGQVGGPVPLTINVGGSYSFPAQLKVTPGDPATIKIIQGNGQTGLPGALLPVTLVGQILDGLGNPLPLTPVSWEVTPAGAATLQLTDSVSDYNGYARTQVRLGSGSGAVQIRLRASGVSAIFTATIVVPVTTLTKVSGDNQPVVIVGQSFPSPLVVLLGNASGQPVAGVPVAWKVTSGSATLSSSSTTSDNAGHAQVSVTAGSVAGPITVSATVAALAPVSFSLTSRVPGPLFDANSFNVLYTSQTGLVAGGYTVLTGKGLAPNITGVVYANTLSASLPTTLANVKIQIGANASNLAPIYAVSNSNGVESVVFITPFDTPAGTVDVTVRVGDGSTAVNGVPVLAYAPAFMETWDNDGNKVPLVIRSDGHLVSMAYPARRGEKLIVYAIGLGQTSPQAQTNVLGAVSQPILAPLALGFGLGAGAVNVTIPASLSRQFISVYEIEVAVPDNAELGPYIPLGMQIAPSGSGPFYAQGNLNIPITTP